MQQERPLQRPLTGQSKPQQFSNQSASDDFGDVEEEPMFDDDDFAAIEEEEAKQLELERL